MYRCGNCNERVRGDVKSIGLQCEKCSSKIFYKERPSTKRTYKSD